jgi:hypothetical protein
MKDEFYSAPATITPNVLFLETSELESKEEMILDYCAILQTCRTKIEIEAVLEDFYEKVVERSGKLIIERQIIDKVKQLNELRSNSKF